MDNEDFRRHAHQLVDWMADYLHTIETRRIVPDVKPGVVRESLPDAPPEAPESFDRVFHDFKERIVPAMTHWQHPGWFAYFPANSSPPSVLAEMLTATLAAQCMSWETSPAATELEQVTLDWLRQMLGLPEGFHGVIQDTASTATLVAFLCARERVTGHGFGQQGRSDETLVAYTSDQSHASVAKAMKLSGMGLANLRTIPSDSSFQMRAESLEAAVQQDIARGQRPVIAVATVGTTSTGAIDPTRDIASICGAHKIWLHVDAAWAGSAAICPEFRVILDGVEHADSFLFNPHKWLLTNFDCTAYFVRDVDVLLKAFSTSPEYLKTIHDPDVLNYRDWQIQLGRRFRALKLWFVLRSYGVSGLQDMIRDHVKLATRLAKRIEDEPRLTLVVPPTLSLVCFRVVSGDADTDSLLKHLNASGKRYLTKTRVDDQAVIRVSIGQRTTGQQHVDDLWQQIVAGLSGTGLAGTELPGTELPGTELPGTGLPGTGLG